MTEFRFTMTNRLGTNTEIDEVPGFDKNQIEIGRNLDWHGVFFNRQGQTLQWIGLPGRMLQAEYDEFGFDGVMYLTVEEKCDGEWLISERGKFVFGAYKYTCSGSECFVNCPLEDIGEIMDLQNRLNQKVNLESLKSFDETTDLVPYDKLPFVAVLPSKGVLLQDHYVNEGVTVTPVQGAPVNDGIGGSGVGNSEFGMIDFGCNKLVAAEIGSFSMRDLPFYNCLETYSATLYGSGCNNPVYFDLYPSIVPTYGTFIKPLDLSPIVNYAEGTASFGVVSSTVDLDINLHADLAMLNATMLKPVSVLCVLPKDKVGTSVNDYIFLQVIENSSSVVYHDPAFVLNPGDRIYAFIWLYHYKTYAQTLVGTPAFSISARDGDYFLAKTLTHTAASKSKLFAINESFSRVAESVTNDKLRVYSDLYGRTDSQPYAMGVDGCGSLTGITNGIRIRRAENRILDKPNLFSISMEDLFDGMNPIHNIGIGVEPDPNRDGFNRLRVEQWDFFYNNTVVMHCLDVNKITRSAYAKSVYSTFKTGFDKYEAEQYNGLDEFLTERYFRTTLSQVKNDLVKLSHFVASGYALEITRRLGNYTSQDWRYDNDTFIICLQRGVMARAIYMIEQTDHTLIVTTSYGVTYDELVEILAVGNVVSFLYGSTPGSPYDLGPFTITGQVMYGSSGGVVITTVETIVPFVTGTYYVSNTNSLDVELGNVTGSQNIIDPDTIYNWRIRPVYNAMRWMNWILQSYRQFNIDSKLVFMDGKGNYHALGEMISTFCKLEPAGLAISEDDMLNLAKFADIDDCTPVLRPERVQFDYPMSTRDYINIKANRYGLIHFTSAECEDDYGWIDKIKYNRTDGTANFLLIPKF